MKPKMVAVAHARSFSGQIERNIDQAIVLVSQAAREGADIVVLPELFLSGYDPLGIKANPDSHVVDLGGVDCMRLTDAVAKLRIAVVVGAAVRVSAGLANAALVIAPDGRIVHVYEKANLWGMESEAFVAGPGPVLVELAGIKIGMAICFDAGFPEHVRALALAGAEFIACPVAFAHGEERHRYQIYFPARALENTVYVGVANAFGEQGGMEMFGESAVFSPRGHRLAAVAGTEGLALIPISQDEITSVRKDLPYLECLPKYPTRIPVIKWS